MLLSMEEMLSKLEQRDKMIKRVFSGDKVLCPKCKKGVLKPVNSHYIKCDNCSVDIIIEARRTA